MNRRRFLSTLLAGSAGAAIAATVDVDRLLWVPGAKTIFLPPPAPPVPTVSIETFKVGDIIMICNPAAFRIDPVRRRATADLREFVVTAAVTGQSGTLNIRPLTSGRPVTKLRRS